MSGPKRGGGYAFPTPSDLHATQGMLLRDYFAAQAISGLLAADVGNDQWHTYEAMVERAWLLADAMLEARNKTPSGKSR